MLRALILSLLLCLCAPLARAGDVVIFAASSLKGALDEVLAGTDARVSYGGSGALARQISQGAPADLFFSATPLWVDEIAPFVASRVDLLGNALVIVSRDRSALQDEGRVAMGLLASVPVGIYGRAYLQAEGLWDAIAPRVVETDSARAALALASRGEVAFAVVYASDAAAVPQVQVVHRFAPRAELPIRYPLALLRDARPEAAQIYERLQSPQARAVFLSHGFLVP